MQIRKYEPADRDALIVLWQMVFPDDPPHNEPAAVIEAKLAVDDLIFVAQQNGEIVGACMAGYDGHRGWLYALAVTPQQRRLKTGKRLVETAMKALRELGCVKLNLQIRTSNAGVAAFYRSLGFEIEDRLSMGVFLD